MADSQDDKTEKKPFMRNIYNNNQKEEQKENKERQISFFITFFLIFCFFLLLLPYFWQLKQANNVDLKTSCRKNISTMETDLLLFLIDSSEKYDGPIEKKIRQKIQEYIKKFKPYGKVVLFLLTKDEQEPLQKISNVCIPSKYIYEIPFLGINIKNKKFVSFLDNLIENDLSVTIQQMKKTLPYSPLLEALNEIYREYFYGVDIDKKKVGSKHIVIFSDMLQNSSRNSFYNNTQDKNINYPAFTDNTKVTICFLEQRIIQRDILSQYWKKIFSKADIKTKNFKTLYLY